MAVDVKAVTISEPGRDFYVHRKDGHRLLMWPYVRDDVPNPEVQILEVDGSLIMYGHFGFRLT